jgi:sec-independent protein translocase protein TatA
MMVENLLNPTHLLAILAVALIVLGPKRLPEAGRGFGAAIRGFKESLSASQGGDERRPMEPSGELNHDRMANGSVTSTAHLQGARK